MPHFVSYVKNGNGILYVSKPPIFRGFDFIAKILYNIWYEIFGKEAEDLEGQAEKAAAPFFDKASENEPEEAEEKPEEEKADITDEAKETEGKPETEKKPR
mgnify:CR=1 FL=1